MFTYKLGNTANVIISSIDAGKIGDYQFQYADEPYTILKEKEVELTFTSVIKEVQTRKMELQYSQDYPHTVKINNVELNDKILNLLYKKIDDGACTVSENHNSDTNGYIYAKTLNKTLYHIFIYDTNGQLENAFSYSEDGIFKVNNPNSNYLIIYTYKGDVGYSLKPLENIYVCLDINSISNTDDITSTSFYHFGKCALQINKDMFFRQNTNTVDLIFKIIDLEDTSIVVERS